MNEHARVWDLLPVFVADVVDISLWIEWPVCRSLFVILLLLDWTILRVRGGELSSEFRTSSRTVPAITDGDQSNKLRSVRIPAAMEDLHVAGLWLDWLTFGLWVSELCGNINRPHVGRHCDDHRFRLFLASS